MANKEDMEPKLPTNNNPPKRTHSLFIASQFLFRFFAFATTLVSAVVTITNKETIEIGVFTMDARYNYDPNFKFFAFANVVACGFSVLSMMFLCMVGGRGSNPHHYFLLFLHDLMMMSLVLAGCAAATAIGLLGKNGNDHSGWMPICDQFVKFCNRGTISIAFAYFAFISLLVLTVISANKSRHVYV